MFKLIRKVLLLSLFGACLSIGSQAEAQKRTKKTKISASAQSSYSGKLFVGQSWKGIRLFVFFRGNW